MYHTGDKYNYNITTQRLLSSTNKTDCPNITEILLKVVLNTINHKPSSYHLDISKGKKSIYTEL
jgi:hypothetical protein